MIRARRKSRSKSAKVSTDFKQVAQLSQRDRASGWVSCGKKVEDDILQTI